MTEPTKEEIATFIKIFDELDLFEAQHFLNRGWGAWAERDFPIPAVVAVMKWLREKRNV